MSRLRRRPSKPAYLHVLDMTAATSTSRTSREDRWTIIYYKYGRLMGVLSRTVLARIHLYEPPSIDDVTIQGGILCRDFIYHRLKRQNLLSVKLELHPSAARGSDVALELQTLSAELEKQYPHLYKNICRQLNIVMSTEQLVRQTFTNISEAMFNGSYVSWGRIVALFLIAGTLSGECVQQGHPEFVRCIVEVFTEVCRTHLAEWIVQQGGWNDVLRVFKTTKETSALWAVTGVGAFIGFLVTMVSTFVL